MRKLMALTGALAIATLGLVACGDDGGEDEDQITEAIERSATSGDPAVCTELQTQRFNEQTNAPATGEEATEACEEDAEEAPGESVEVSNVEVDGDSATAEAAITGSFFDGQTLEIALVKESDQWKLDELTGFAGFDRDAFVEAVSSGDEEIPQQARDCLVQQIEPLSDEELQDLFLNPSEETEQRIFAPCFEEEQGQGGGQGQ